MSAVNLFKAHHASKQLWTLAFDIPLHLSDFLTEALSEWCLSLATLTPDPPAPGRMELLLEEAPDASLWQNRLRPLFAVADLPVPALEITEVEDRNWLLAVQQSFAPIAAGRFWLHGSHIEEAPPANTHPILVDAGLAFGSGEHGTTWGCLMAIDWLAEKEAGIFSTPKARFLDVGTGSGILAMAMAHLVPEHSASVIATDIDAVAVEVCRENSEKNQLADRILPLHADGMAHAELAAHAPYRVITANILAQPLVNLAPDLAAALEKTGYLILSGLLETQENLVLPAYSPFGLKLLHAIRRDGWSALVLQRLP